MHEFLCHAVMQSYAKYNTIPNSNTAQKLSCLSGNLHSQRLFFFFLDRRQISMISSDGFIYKAELIPFLTLCCVHIQQFM